MKKRTAAFLVIVLSGAASTGAIAQRESTVTTSRESSPDRGGVLRTPEPTKGTILRSAEISRSDIVRDPPRTAPARPDVTCEFKVYYWYIQCCGGAMGMQNVRHWKTIGYGENFDFSGTSLGKVGNTSTQGREFQVELWVHNFGNRGGAKPVSNVTLSRNGQPKEWSIELQTGSWSGAYPLDPGEAILVEVFRLSEVVWGWVPLNQLMPGMNKIDALAKIAAIPDEANLTNNACSFTFSIDWKK